jgi:hypothetical protein
MIPQHLISQTINPWVTDKSYRVGWVSQGSTQPVLNVGFHIRSTQPTRLQAFPNFCQSISYQCTTMLFAGATRN